MKDREQQEPKEECPEDGTFATLTLEEYNDLCAQIFCKEEDLDRIGPDGKRLH